MRYPNSFLHKVLCFIGYEFLLYDTPIYNVLFCFGLICLLVYLICITNSFIMLQGDVIGILQTCTSVGYLIMVNNLICLFDNLKFILKL